jgi:biotin transport system substrate-specific component
LQAVFGMTFIDALKVNIPFIIGDLIKAVLAAAIAYKVSTNPQMRKTLAS